MAGMNEADLGMIRIIYFGRPAEVLGPGRSLDLPKGGATVGDLRRMLAATDPLAAAVLLRPDVRASLDAVVVPEDTPVRDGQEVAYFSIWSGG